MATKIVRAEELQIGDVLVAGRGHGTMSVKNVYTQQNPVTGRDEVVVIGSPSIMDKMDIDERVSVLV